MSGAVTARPIEAADRASDASKQVATRITRIAADTGIFLVRLLPCCGAMSDAAGVTIYGES